MCDTSGSFFSPSIHPSISIKFYTLDYALSERHIHPPGRRTVYVNLELKPLSLSLSIQSYSIDGERKGFFVSREDRRKEEEGMQK